jgi:hypothetical protein
MWAVGIAVVASSIERDADFWLGILQKPRTMASFGFSRNLTRRILPSRHAAENSQRWLSAEMRPADAETLAVLQGPNLVFEGPLPLRRHGPGDGVLRLNVGGTEFITLRSTVNSNPVLLDRVTSAEANTEVLHNGAIFIDRDPKHFGIILQHLRNRVEMLSYYSQGQTKIVPMASKAFTDTYIQLPEDDAILRDLYLEATYFRIPELQAALYEKNWFVKIMSMFSGGKNPFDMATRWLAWLRGALITFGSLGTIGGTVFVTMKRDMQTALQAVGIHSNPLDEESKGLFNSLPQKDT